MLGENVLTRWCDTQREQSNKNWREQKFPRILVGLLWESSREWSQYYRKLIPREIQGLLYLGMDVKCWTTSATQMHGKQLSFVRYSLASFHITMHY